MAQQQPNYAALKKNFIEQAEVESKKARDDHKPEIEGCHYGQYCKYILLACEQDLPSLHRKAISNKAFQEEVKKLALNIADSKKNIYMYICNDLRAIEMMREDEHYQDFIQKYKSLENNAEDLIENLISDTPPVNPIILNPPVDLGNPEQKHNSSKFNFKTKLFLFGLFAAPPVIVGAAYADAAIKNAGDVKAVNDFFASNLAVIAAISAVYYTVLVLAVVCRNRAPAVNSVENNHQQTAEIS